MPSGFKSFRDVFTAILGAGGIVHETILAQSERPTLLIIFAGLLGLPLVFKESDKGGGEKSPSADKSGTDGGD